MCLTYWRNKSCNSVWNSYSFKDKLSLIFRCSYSFTCNLLLSIGMYIQRSTQFCRELGGCQITLFNKIWKITFQRLLSGKHICTNSLSTLLYSKLSNSHYNRWSWQLDDFSYRIIWILLTDVYAETKSEECTEAFLLCSLSKWDPSSFFAFFFSTCGSCFLLLFVYFLFCASTGDHINSLWFNSIYVNKKIYDIRYQH